MKNINSTEELKDVILQLENRQAIQQQLLKEQFNLVYSSLKPVNIIKNTIKEAITSHEIQNDIIGYLANVAADFVMKPFTKGTSNNYFKKYFGQILHQGISTLITLNSDNIRTMGNSLINKFFRKNKKEDNE